MAILVLLIALLPAVGVQAGNGKGNDNHSSGNGATIQGDQHPGQGVPGKAGKKINPAKMSLLSDEAGAEKENVCHRKGNGTFFLINISVDAVPAHLAHGDALPGDPVPGVDGDVFDEACKAIETIRVTSPPMAFGPMGWGGWSCPAGTTVIAGGYEPANLLVTYSGPAKPGVTTKTTPAYTYPIYPHYTFPLGETGWVVQNINTGQTLSVYVICTPTAK